MKRAALALMLLAGPAMAHGFTAEENAWLNRQRAVDGTKCCDENDAHVSPNVEWRIGPAGYQVLIGGVWRDVPPGRLLRINPADPSPWGAAALLFHSNGALWCFMPEPLT